MHLASELGHCLTELGTRVRQQIIETRDLGSDSQALGTAAGDMVFGIDRKVEPLIVEAMASLPKRLLPVLVICEGLGEDGRRRFGPPDEPLKFRILIDPIDGTRSLMYDKRSAWFLAAAAPDCGDKTRLSETIASVMVELPTSKQGQGDIYSFVSGAVSASRDNFGSGTKRDLKVGPSSATNLRQGFAQVSNFFPGTKVLASELMEAIASATLGAVSIEEAAIFDDQYISTGGQLAELMNGHDRFSCDLRPLFYDVLRIRDHEIPQGLCCHPYDLAGLAIAQAMGVILTDGLGRPLDAHFEIDTPVHWCGYANVELRLAIEPVIQSWFAEKLTGQSR